MDDPGERLEDAYATLLTAIDAAMDVVDQADMAVRQARAASLAADRAARSAADARRNSRKVKQRLDTALGILRSDEGTTP